MTSEKLEKAVKEALPAGWNVEKASFEEGVIKLTCPTRHRFGERLFKKVYQPAVEEVEKVSGFVCDGGGAVVGGDRYDIYFFKPEKHTKKTK